MPIKERTRRTIKRYTMPLSYQGFAPAAILLIVLTLVLKQGYDYWKHLHQKF